MGRVTLDPSLSAQLGSTDLPVEVYDPAGKSLGFFVPSKTYYASAKYAVSNEELERRLREGGGRTWPEIRADLEKKYGPA